ncbi:ornithine cyclodeaminase family protein [Pseudarthrobacter sp. NS4]|uniref:ornithine cyclodeaminase family protein n=1 Tax=Pseudarthrobacter sp. NS4 TaxID=2973976 RepID=UPI002162B69A|nr:ornithine cyclodeaminase family protein [Pseudarthrobacter sp. NS4]
MRSLLSPAQATAAITNALLSGLDPATDPSRRVLPLRQGQFLIMPAESGEYAGVKVATVAPANPDLNLPRIQALYLIFDAQTLTPQAVLDGSALTALRTPAVSVTAILPALALGSAPLKLAVFGAGRQGVAHVETVMDVMEGRREIERVTYIVRSPDRVRLPPSAVADVVGLDSAEAESAVAAANLVICATSAHEPLFDSSLLRPDSIVIAVGSHEAHAREVDASLCGRAQVVVEDVRTALRESGDVIMAIQEGHLKAEDLIPIRAVVTGAVELDTSIPVLFKSSGMSWEDLIVAEAVVQAMSGNKAERVHGMLRKTTDGIASGDSCPADKRGPAGQ